MAAGEDAICEAARFLQRLEAVCLCLACGLLASACACCSKFGQELGAKTCTAPIQCGSQENKQTKRVSSQITAAAEAQTLNMHALLGGCWRCK